MIALTSTKSIPEPKVDTSIDVNLQKVKVGLNVLNITNSRALIDKSTEMFKLKQEIGKKNLTIHQLSTQVETCNNSLNDVKKELNAKTQELIHLQAENIRLNGLYNSARQNNQLMELNSSVNVVNREIEKAKQDYTTLQKRYKDKELDLKKALDENIKKSKEITSIKEQFTKKSNELELLLASNSLAVKDLALAKKEIADYEDNLKLLRKTVHDITLKATQSGIESRQHSSQLEDELNKMKRDYALLLEQNSNMSTIMATSRASCQEAINNLEKSQRERERLEADLYMEQQRVINQEYEFQHKQLAIQESHKTSIIELEAKCKTLQELLKNNTTVIEQSAQIDLERERLKNEIISINGHYESEMNRYTLEYDKIRQEAEESKNTITNLNNELTAKAAELVKKTGEFEMYQQQVKNYEQTIKTLFAEYPIEGNDKYMKMAKDYEAVKAGFLQYRKEQGEHALKLKEAIEAKSLKIEKFKVLAQKLKQTNKTHETTKEELVAAHRKEIEALHEHYKQTYRSLSPEEQSKLLNAAKRIHELENKIQTQERNFETETHSAVHQHSIKINNLETRLNQKEKELESVTQQAISLNTSLKSKVDEMNKTMTSIQDEKNRMELELRQKIQKLKEKKSNAIKELNQQITTINDEKHKVLQASHEAYQSKITELEQKMEENTKTLNAQILTLNQQYLNSQTENQRLQGIIDSLQQAAEITKANEESFAEKLRNLGLRETALTEAGKKYMESRDEYGKKMEQYTASNAALQENQTKLMTDIMNFEKEKEEFLLKQQAFQDMQAASAVETEEKVAKAVKEALEKQAERALKEESKRINEQKVSTKKILEEEKAMLREKMQQSEKVMEIERSKRKRDDSFQYSEKRIRLNTGKVAKAAKEVMDIVGKVQAKQRSTRHQGNVMIAKLDLKEMEEEHTLKESKKQPAFALDEAALRTIISDAANNVSPTQLILQDELKNFKPTKSIPVSKVHPFAQQFMEQIGFDEDFAMGDIF